MKNTTISLYLVFLLTGCGSENTNIVLDDNKTNTKENSNNPIEVESGKKLFINNCATCHGADAKGKTGPNIVGITDEDIEEEILGNSAMTFLSGVFSSEDRRVMALYLDELKKAGTNDEKNFKEKADLGDSLFYDTILSKKQTLSCASCHNPEYGYIDNRFDTNPVNGALSVGDDGQTLGGRNSQTISYGKFIPDLIQIDENTYLGGQFWDGRAKNQKEQAKGPILDHAEMMISNEAEAVARIKNSTYQSEFKKLYGDDIFDDTTKAYDAIADAISKYEMTKEFAPFDSKYDRSKLPYYHVDHYEMSEQEKLGYKLFFSDKTHCRKCHTTSSNTESSVETFTNSHYENIGVPKNLTALLERDGNISKIDLGLGGVLKEPKHYGKFKVPTLRNIAVTAPYMSNGVFKELKTVIKYFLYMAGHGDGINPETRKAWEKAEVNGTINHETLKTLEPLSDEEIDALESFLKILTDRKFENL